MKTIDHLINKNVFYLGNNYEYFKHISRYFALQRCKSVFISNKKEAINSIDRELGNMRATSYSYHTRFDDHDKYIKNITRILKSRDTPDYLIISFKPEFEDIDETSNPLLSGENNKYEEMINFYINNTLITIKYFMEVFIAQGKGKIINITTDTSSNPLEKAIAAYLDTYILSLRENLEKNGYKQIDCKVIQKKSEKISYDKFVLKIVKSLTSKKGFIKI